MKSNKPIFAGKNRKMLKNGAAIKSNDAKSFDIRFVERNQKTENKLLYKNK